MPSPTICDPSNSSVEYTNTKHYCLSINSIKSRHSCGRVWLSEAKPNVMHKHHLVCGHNHVIRPSTASLPPLPRHTRERHVTPENDTSHPRTTRHTRGRHVTPADDTSHPRTTRHTRERHVTPANDTSCPRTRASRENQTRHFHIRIRLQLPNPRFRTCRLTSIRSQPPRPIMAPATPASAPSRRARPCGTHCPDTSTASDHEPKGGNDTRSVTT